MPKTRMNVTALLALYRSVSNALRREIAAIGAAHRDQLFKYSKRDSRVEAEAYALPATLIYINQYTQQKRKNEQCAANQIYPTSNKSPHSENSLTEFIALTLLLDLVYLR